MTALGGVVFTTALMGMAIAVALSLLAILYQASRPYIAVLGRIPGDPADFADAGRHRSAAPLPGFLMVRPNVPLTFVNADVAKDQIMTLLRGRSGAPAALVLDLGATADLDVATNDMLRALHTDLRESGIELRLAQVRGSVRDRMRRTGLMGIVGEDHCYLSNEVAAAAPLPARPPADSSPAEEPAPGAGARSRRPRDQRPNDVRPHPSGGRGRSSGHGDDRPAVRRAAASARAWHADAAGVHALDTFQHDGDGQFLTRFGVDLGSSAAAMITLEPEGGAVGEPGPQVAFGELKSTASTSGTGAPPAAVRSFVPTATPAATAMPTTASPRTIT